MGFFLTLKCHKGHKTAIKKAALHGDRKGFPMNNVSQNLELFNNKELGEVRVAVRNNEPLFCLSDVCRALQIGNPSDVKKRLNPDGVDSIEVIDSMGRTQRAAFVNESNLYKTIFQSRTKKAEEFTEWVTSDVIPSIRKHGAYATPATIENIISNPDFGIELLQRLKDEQEKRKQVELENEEMKPKAIFADAVAASDDSILIGALAKLLNQNGVDIGQKRLFAWMRDNGYLIKDGRDKNIPTQRAMDMDLFKVKERTITNPDGSSRLTRTTLVTGKGQQYFVNKFLGGAAE